MKKYIEKDLSTKMLLETEISSENLNLKATQTGICTSRVLVYWVSNYFNIERQYQYMAKFVNIAQK